MGRILLSICAVVVAVGLGAAQSANPAGEQANGQRRPAEDQNRAQSQAATATPTVEESLQRIARHMEAYQTEGHSQEPENGAKRDLAAQENMALWAMWVFIAAGVGTVISGFGVVLIWRTLLYTRTAATHSAAMVGHAQQTTEAAQAAAQAAQAQIEQAAETAKRQLRAYLHVQPLKIYWREERGAVFAIPIENTGQTPAVRFRLGISRLSVVNRSETPLITLIIPDDDDLSFDNWSAIGAGRKRVCVAYPINRGSFDPEDFYEQSGVSLVLAGRVHYVDIFGDEWLTEFIAHLSSDWESDRQKMSFCGAPVRAYHPS